MIIAIDLKETNPKAVYQIIKEQVDESYRQKNSHKKKMEFSKDERKLRKYIASFDLIFTEIKEILSKESEDFTVLDLIEYAAGKKKLPQHNLNTIANKRKESIGINNKKQVLGFFKSAVRFIQHAPNIPFR